MVTAELTAIVLSCVLAGPAGGAEPADAAARLMQALKTERHWVLRAKLARDAGKEAVPGLIRALGEPDSYSRLVAAEALGYIGPVTEQVVPALLMALREGDRELRGAAATALRDMPADRDKIVEALIAAMMDKEERVRGRAAQALGSQGYHVKDKRAAVLPALAGGLNDPHAQVRCAAAMAMGDMSLNGRGVKEAVPHLVRALGDNVVGVRSCAARALGVIGPLTDEVTPALVSLSRDKEMALREAAIRSLGRVARYYLNYHAPEKARELIPRLLEAAGDANSGVRYAVAAALGEAGPVTDQVVPALIRLLDDEHSGVRHAAATSLASFGAEAAEAVTALEKTLRDTEPEVRQAVENALTRIRAGEKATDK